MLLRARTASREEERDCSRQWARRGQRRGRGRASGGGARTTISWSSTICFACSKRVDSIWSASRSSGQRGADGRRALEGPLQGPRRKRRRDYQSERGRARARVKCNKRQCEDRKRGRFGTRARANLIFKLPFSCPINDARARAVSKMYPPPPKERQLNAATQFAQKASEAERIAAAAAAAAEPIPWDR